jgi:hypothetical protein
VQAAVVLEPLVLKVYKVLQEMAQAAEYKVKEVSRVLMVSLFKALTVDLVYKDRQVLYKVCRVQMVTMV